MKSSSPRERATKVFRDIQQFMHQHNVGQLDEKADKNGMTVFAASEERGSKYTLSWSIAHEGEDSRVAITISEKALGMIQVTYHGSRNGWTQLLNLDSSTIPSLGWLQGILKMNTATQLPRKHVRPLLASLIEAHQAGVAGTSMPAA